MRMRWKVMLVPAFVLALSPLSTGQPHTADDVLKAREAALAAGDANAVLRLFADDALVVTSSGRLLVGTEQVATWVNDQVRRSQREEAGVRQAQGTKLTWAAKVYRDDWQKLGVSPLDVRQDAIIESGRIRFFNTSFTPESADRLDSARKQREEPAADERGPNRPAGYWNSQRSFQRTVSYSSYEALRPSDRHP